MIHFLLLWHDVAYLYRKQCCCQNLFKSRDRDLGHQVLRSRPRPWTSRPRPWPSGLETETLAIRSRDQDKTLDFMCQDPETLAFWSRDRDLGLLVSRPRPWPSGLETETLAFRSRDRDLGHQVSRSRQDLGLQVSRPRDLGLLVSESWTFSTKHERIL